jgi:hypothetical protein
MSYFKGQQHLTPNHGSANINNRIATTLVTLTAFPFVCTFIRIAIVIIVVEQGILG